MSSSGGEDGGGGERVIVEGEVGQHLTKVRDGGGAREGSERRLTTAAMSLS